MHRTAKPGSSADAADQLTRELELAGTPIPIIDLDDVEQAEERVEVDPVWRNGNGRYPVEIPFARVE